MLSLINQKRVKIQINKIIDEKSYYNKCQWNPEDEEIMRNFIFQAVIYNNGME
jgi:hypothetical protein